MRLLLLSTCKPPWCATQCAGGVACQCPHPMHISQHCCPPAGRCSGRQTPPGPASECRLHGEHGESREGVSVLRLHWHGMALRGCLLSTCLPTPAPAVLRHPLCATRPPTREGQQVGLPPARALLQSKGAGGGGQQARCQQAQHLQEIGWWGGEQGTSKTAALRWAGHRCSEIPVLHCWSWLFTANQVQRGHLLLLLPTTSCRWPASGQPKQTPLPPRTPHMGVLVLRRVGG